MPQGPGYHLEPGECPKPARRVSRNKTIFERIAKEMRGRGHQKTWQQCRTKIRTDTKVQKGQRMFNLFMVLKCGV